MALEDRPIPTLTGKDAERFIAEAEAAEERARYRKPIDKELLHGQICAILKKGNML